MVEALRIAVNNEAVPDWWIELLCEDPSEAALWKAREFARGG